MKIKGASGREYEEWKPPEESQVLSEEAEERLSAAELDRDVQLKRWGQTLMNTAVELKELQEKNQELREQNFSLKKTLTHLTTLIQTFGLCRPETQLARMELGEATERYVMDKSYDEKNLGVIAKNLLKEMREKGELPDED